MKKNGKKAADPFHQVLREGRERFNSLVAAARLSRGGFDEAWFSEHLENVVGRVVRAVAAIAPDRAFAVGDTLFGLSIRLWERGVLGPATRFAAISQGWERVLPAVAPILVVDPRRIAAAVANALFKLSSEPEYRSSFWIETMTACGPSCGSVEEFLDLGRVVAWRSGMARLRESALDACGALPPALATKALGMAVTPAAPSRLTKVLAALRADPWAAPEVAEIAEASGASGAPDAAQDGIVLAGRVGAFSGFNGRLSAPPLLLGMEAETGAFVLDDRGTAWRVVADRHGSSWERLREVPDGLRPAVRPGDGPFARLARAASHIVPEGPAKTLLQKLRDLLPIAVEKPPTATPGEEFAIDRRGEVSWNGVKTVFPELASWTAFAAGASMAVVTLADSHAVHVLSSRDGDVPGVRPDGEVSPGLSRRGGRP